MPERIYLSPPHLSGNEMNYIQEAIDSNWVSPAGPHLPAFEAEFAAYVGSTHAVALSSGTAALHLALRHLGVGAGDEVFVSTLTFCGSINPILYENAIPIFVDSEPHSWNIDPDLLREAFQERAAKKNLPKALIVVHLYGQSADMDTITALCQEYDVPLIEDAAEGVGTSYRGKAVGSFGLAGVFSFNGNKIITTSGGGMCVSDDKDFVDHVRKMATQAREPEPHYEHTERGFNYRLSNILAGIGRGQLEVIEERVAQKRKIFEYYVNALGDIDGITFMPDAGWGRHTRWLTTLLVDDNVTGVDREAIRLMLEDHNIESRPLWKPMHMQPVYAEYEVISGKVAEDLFEQGLCLPSATALPVKEYERIVSLIREALGA